MQRTEGIPDLNCVSLLAGSMDFASRRKPRNRHFSVFSLSSNSCVNHGFPILFPHPISPFVYFRTLPCLCPFVRFWTWLQIVSSDVDSEVYHPQGSHFPAVTKFQGVFRVFSRIETKIKGFFSKVASTYIWVSIHNTTFYLTTILPKYKTSPSRNHQSKVLIAVNKERLECNI